MSSQLQQIILEGCGAAHNMLYIYHLDSCHGAAIVLMDTGSSLGVEWLEWAPDCVFQALVVEEHSANWLPEPLN